jgi:hypothetical protein
MNAVLGRLADYQQQHEAKLAQASGNVKAVQKRLKRAEEKLQNAETKHRELSAYAASIGDVVTVTALKEALNAANKDVRVLRKYFLYNSL